MKNKFEHFLVSCSGANKEILQSCPRSEIIKQAGIGTTILLTSILAFFSGSYALFTIFKNYPTAIIFGITWAIMIFNLDRLIVSSMRKRGNFLSQFKMAIPRIFLALIIAIVISKPLEIKLLESKIEKELFHIKKQQTDVLSEECKNIANEFESKINAEDKKVITKENQKPLEMVELEGKEMGLQSEIKSLEKSIRKKNAKYYKEIRSLEQKLDSYSESDDFLDVTTSLQNEIKQLNRKIYGNKRPIRRKSEELQKVKKDIDVAFATYRSDMANLKTEVTSEKDRLRIERDKQMAECQSTLAKGGNLYTENSLPDLIVALSSAGDKNSVVSWISIFIMLLFIIVETVPIFVKLISPRGPYDELLDAEEHKIKIEAMDSINEQNRLLNKKISILQSIDEQEITQELDNNKRIIKSISDAHHVLVKDQLDIWLEEERKKIKKNGSSKD